VVRSFSSSRTKSSPSHFNITSAARGMRADARPCALNKQEVVEEGEEEEDDDVEGGWEDGEVGREEQHIENVGHARLAAQHRIIGADPFPPRSLSLSLSLSLSHARSRSHAHTHRHTRALPPAR
jgi:hypothetical protein